MKEMNEIQKEGLLERYVLGELDKAERIEVEEAIMNYPDLKEKLNQIEENLERMAFENAVTPPPGIKKRLIRQLTEDNEVRVKPARSLKPTSKFYLGVAATLAVLFLLSSFWLYQKMNGFEQDLRLVNEQNSELLETNQNLLSTLEESNKWLKAVNSSETEKFIMPGNDLMPEAVAVSYVNHTEKTVILNANGLPQLPNDKDYQLWADVEGEMIDMGVIPKNTDMAVMTYIEDAESLNITIEPKGGNDHPTVSNLISFVSI